ncbi:MAG: ABC transporter [Candidatus Nephthysia bennettiae]|uniref:ABC transporter ATP-binding protein n=1 Tax=Candidatus Nephthysia bennettiae TaxID=3127016 RepID=A0A934K5H0_9BACT|nr:ABC transporter ATP-binding protein [Candidatus Dormibacteraeota bacterium]MBJ7611678.1 ABC transporter ATP-binding protein [Candidatus Dormibacteraeota bacterium]PZR88577.1 MAG: ABC transporter [Candidatus Dormibacteraeota bacterium]
MASQRADAWRGVAAEELDDLPAEISALYRRRSRRLLASLLAPMRGRLLLAGALILLRTGGTLAIPYLVGQAIDQGIRAGRPAVLEVYAALVVGAALVAALGNWAFLRVAGRIGQDFLYELRMRIYTHVQALSISFYERYTSGRIISRLTNDIDTLTDLLATGLTSLATAALSIVAIAAVLLLLDWRLGAVTLLTFPLILILTAWFRTNSSHAYRAVRQAIALVIVHFTESLGGIRAVQAYSREERNQQIFEELDARYRDANALSVRLSSTYAPGISLLGRIATLTVLVLGSLLVLGGSLTVGVLTAFVLYVRQFFEPMQDLTQFYNLFQAAAAALEKLSGVLEERPALPEPARPVRRPRWDGSLEFSEVTFAYQEAPVLQGLSFSVPAGQTLALVGRTGAGKSTIARLMARFYDPIKGEVRLDGVDLRQMAKPDLRRTVIMVTQESFLFSGSIAENIGFGRPEAGREEIEAAARAVGAHPFIDRLPEGYDTQVRRRGVRLSAGQRQLVAFARAFLAEPRVLILDEATSSLDVPSERLVQHALQVLLAERTAVIIAHRLSTVEIADRVLVLHEGELVEDGPPASLVRSGGRYQELQRAWLESLA